jgi:hypothetical protein
MFSFGLTPHAWTLNEDFVRYNDRFLRSFVLQDTGIPLLVDLDNLHFLVILSFLGNAIATEKMFFWIYGAIFSKKGK